MKRISRDFALLSTALIMAKRSTCLRKQVGAVIGVDGRILSTGYAGAPSGFEHCSEKICDMSKPCLRTVHAEANAIAFAARYGIPTKGATLYTSVSPCSDCSKLIINAGIREVIYFEQYRLTDGLDMLRDAGLEVEQMKIERELDLLGIE